MINIKEYKIKLDDKSEKFYENMSKFLDKPVEKVLENTLVHNIELMNKVIDITN